MPDDFELFHQRRTRRPLKDVSNRSRNSNFSKKTGNRSLTRLIESQSPKDYRNGQDTKNKHTLALSSNKKHRICNDDKENQQNQQDQQNPRNQQNQQSHKVAKRYLGATPSFVPRPRPPQFSVADYNPTLAASNRAVRTFVDRLRLAQMAKRDLTMEGPSLPVARVSRLGAFLTAVSFATPDCGPTVLMDSGETVSPGDRLLFGRAKNYSLGGRTVPVYAMWKVAR